MTKPKRISLFRHEALENKQEKNNEYDIKTYIPSLFITILFVIISIIVGNYLLKI